MKAGWQRTSLGSILSILNGYAFDAKAFTAEAGTPLIRIRDLKNGVTTQTNFDGPFDQRYIVKSGSFLIGMDGEFGCFEWHGPDALLNQRVCKLHSFSADIDPKFLFYGINKHLKEIEDNTTFTTVKHLSSKQIANIEFDFPSIDEQRRIVAVLDKAFAGIATATANAQKNLTNARALFENSIEQAFARSAAKSAWAHHSVESAAASHRGSIRTGPFGSQLLHSEFVDEGIAVLGIDNAVTNEFRWDKLRFISPKKFEALSRYRVFPGDVIITIMGTCGRCAVIPADIPLAINTKHLCCITVDTKKCLPDFLHAYFLYHPTAREYLGRTAKGSIMAGLNMGLIKYMPLLLPTITEQRRLILLIADLKRATDELASNLTAKLAALTELKQSLLQKAFAGELT